MARKIDQFARKRCQTKRKDVGYKLIIRVFFQKYIVVQELQAIKLLKKLKNPDKNRRQKIIYKNITVKNIEHFENLKKSGKNTGKNPVTNSETCFRVDTHKIRA